jgi:hypothetical protein
MPLIFGILGRMVSHHINKPTMEPSNSNTGSLGRQM